MKGLPDPKLIAYRAIETVMTKGTTKTNRPDWRDESQDYHIDRAIRHIITYRLIRDGNQPDDGENHLELALTRAAMALTQD